MTASSRHRRWRSTAGGDDPARETLPGLAHRYRALVGSIDQGFCVIEVRIDPPPFDGRVVEVNHAFEKQTGLVDMEGRWLREALPDLEEAWFETYARVAMTGEPLRFERRATALGRWFEVDAFPVGTPQQHRVALLFRDVTARKEREARRALLDRLAVRYAHSSNPEAILGLTARAVASHLRVPGVSVWRVEGKGGKARVLHAHGEEGFLRGDDGRSLPQRLGTARWRELEAGRCVVVREGEEDGTHIFAPCTGGEALDLVLVAHHDEARTWEEGQIAFLHELGPRLRTALERAWTEEALRRREHELREMSRSLERRVRERTSELQVQTHRLRRLTVELSTAEQRERRRLAAVLHDDLQQLLFAARLRLEQVRNDGGVSTEGAAMLEEAGRRLADAISATRELTCRLRPPALTDGALGPAIDWLAEEMSRLHDLEVSRSMTEPAPALDDELATLLVECLRELLFNVAKHARVSRAEVRAEPAGDRLRLVVADEGEGFDTAELGRPRPCGGLGLFGIEERLAAVGGSMHVESAPGEGTRIELVVPLG